VGAQVVEVGGTTFKANALRRNAECGEASTQMPVVGWVCQRLGADQQARCGGRPQYSRPDTKGKVVQLVRRGQRAQGKPASVAPAGRGRYIRYRIQDLKCEIGAPYAKHPLGVEALLRDPGHRVVADNAIEAIETRGREAVEPPELHRRRTAQEQPQPLRYT